MITKSGEVVEKLAKQYGCQIWESRDGMLTPLAIMNDRHLTNSHAYLLERRTSVEQNQILSANIERLLGNAASAWLTGEEWNGHAIPNGIQASTYGRWLTEIEENLQALEAEGRNRGIKLEGSVGYGMAGNRRGVGERESKNQQGVIGYCRKIAAALRLPYLGRSR